MGLSGNENGPGCAGAKVVFAWVGDIKPAKHSNSKLIRKPTDPTYVLMIW